MVLEGVGDTVQRAWRRMRKKERKRQSRGAGGRGRSGRGQSKQMIRPRRYGPVYCNEPGSAPPIFDIKRQSIFFLLKICIVAMKSQNNI